jgi:molecular chaperone GrpE
LNAKKNAKNQKEKTVKGAEEAQVDQVGQEINQENPSCRPQEETERAVEEMAAAKAQQEIDQLKDQLLRLNADFDNFRKRTLRDKQDWSRYASQSIAEKLLPVIDGLEAAGAAVRGAGQETKSVAEGFLMIQKQLMDILNQEGLEEIPALDQNFDPNIHEAVMTVACTGDQEDNQIVMVLRKGYRYKDKVLRPAMVQVAKKE